MPTDHTEKGFENAVTASLLAGGYVAGDPAKFDAKLALDPSTLVRFLKTSQPKEWARLVTIYGAEVEGKVVGTIARDLDPHEPLFQFKKRCLVHFAVDPDEVHMTTRLEGKKTVFLPFNKGRDGSKGNPDNPGGYKTAYLWEEVWRRDSWLDILARFVH